MNNIGPEDGYEELLMLAGIFMLLAGTGTPKAEEFAQEAGVVLNAITNWEVQ